MKQSNIAPSCPAKNNFAQLADLCRVRPLTARDLQSHGLDPTDVPDEARFGNARSIYKACKPSWQRSTHGQLETELYQVFQVPERLVQKHRERTDALRGIVEMQTQFAAMRQQLLSEHAACNQPPQGSTPPATLPRQGAGQGQQPGELGLCRGWPAQGVEQSDLSASVPHPTLEKISDSLGDMSQSLRKIQEHLAPKNGWLYQKVSDYQMPSQGQFTLNGYEPVTSFDRTLIVRRPLND